MAGRGNLSVYRTEAIDALLEPRLGEEYGATMILSVAAARYQEIVGRHVPRDLDREQWHALCQILSGMPEQWSPGYMEAEVADAIRLRSVATPIDGDRLMTAVRGWDYATRVAVMDHVERWWAAHTRDPETADGVLPVAP